MIRAAIYTRISDDRDGSAAGVARQEADCRALAERRGWTVTSVHVDNDISAWKGRTRPEYRRLLEIIKQHDVDAIVVWHLDRLHRHPRELEEFFEVCDGAGLKHMASVTGDVDLSTHDGRFMARILGAVARKESDDKSRRTLRKHQELAEQGAPVGGGRPFGYELDRITVRPAEATLILEAAGRILAGEPLRSIAGDWNRRPVPPVKGERWTQTSLRRILTSARIAGLRTHGPDGPAVPAQWPAIVDETTWRRLRLILKDPSRRLNAGFGARHLLTGLAVCDLCDHRLIARPHSRRKPCYVCTSDPGRGGCGKIRVVSRPLEEYVADRLFAAVDDEAWTVTWRRRTTLQVDETALLEQVAGDEALLEQLARDMAERAISRTEWLAARQVIEDRITGARRQLRSSLRKPDADQWIDNGGALRGAWPTMTVDQRRAVLVGCITEIRIGSATPGLGRFDPGRVRIVWTI